MAYRLGIYDYTKYMYQYDKDWRESKYRKEGGCASHH